MQFDDRKDAGRRLAEKLVVYLDRKDVIVLGLARGGVVVAASVASQLHLPVGVIVVRKVGSPGNPELALGAIAEEGEGVFNEDLMRLLGVSHKDLADEVVLQRKILLERLKLYRGKSSAPVLKGKTVILVDDGIATGASMRAAIQSVRVAGVAKIVLAVPVAAQDSLYKIKDDVDVMICLSSPVFFQAVGSFYRHFDQTSDEEVIRILGLSF